MHVHGAELLQGGQQSPRLGKGLTGKTLQSPLSSDGGPSPYLGAEGRHCEEGDLSTLKFRNVKGREMKYEAMAIVHIGADGGGMDQHGGHGDGEKSMDGWRDVQDIISSGAVM